MRVGVAMTRPLGPVGMRMQMEATDVLVQVLMFGFT